MSYKESIAKEIQELFNTAPPGTNTYYLEHFNQVDVADTVNQLASQYPRNVQTTLVDYSNKAAIVFTK